ncbi:MAG: hypothetical protein KGP14_16050, partial [Betaproteobacteria bacterium]|nr:hypothetical protein [Betaproteobacteria bacterium]
PGYFFQSVEYDTAYSPSIALSCPQEVRNMTTSASIVLFKNEFVATLSDGRHIQRNELREMAAALASEGVHACDVQFEWNGSAGQRMITAGQQVAMRAEIRRQERLAGKGFAVAA